MPAQVVEAGQGAVRPVRRPGPSAARLALPARLSVRPSGRSDAARSGCSRPRRRRSGSPRARPGTLGRPTQNQSANRIASRSRANSVSEVKLGPGRLRSSGISGSAVPAPACRGSAGAHGRLLLCPALASHRPGSGQSSEYGNGGSIGWPSVEPIRPERREIDAAGRRARDQPGDALADRRRDLEAHAGEPGRHDQPVQAGQPAEQRPGVGGHVVHAGDPARRCRRPQRGHPVRAAAWTSAARSSPAAAAGMAIRVDAALAGEGCRPASSSPRPRAGSRSAWWSRCRPRGHPGPARGRAPRPGGTRSRSAGTTPCGPAAAATTPRPPRTTVPACSRSPPDALPIPATHADHPAAVGDQRARPGRVRR